MTPELHDGPPVRARGRFGRLAKDWRVVGTTAGMKVLVMGLSGVLGIITSRLIIQNFGVGSYAQYGLLASLPALLPFADLGIGTAVIGAVAGSTSADRDEHVRRTLTSALRLLLVSGMMIVSIAVVLYVTGMWPVLLGSGLLPGGDGVVMLCFVVFGMTLPLTIGARILIGLNKNPSQVAAQGVVAPFILLCVGASVVFGIAADNVVALFSFLAATASALICLAIATRSISPQVTRAVAAVPRFRSDPSVRIMDTAWPMLIQLMALPLAMQTDRILISHLADTATLTEYNLAFQLFSIILQTVAAAGVALWPLYARARAAGDIRSPIKPALVFLVAGLAMALAMVMISPWLARLVSDGKIELGGWVLFGFVSFVAVQALKYPLGMYMTDKRGLRFQVLPTIVMVPVSIGLSWYLIGVIGAGGPAIGSTVAVFTCQVAPMTWFVLRDLGRRRLEAARG